MAPSMDSGLAASAPNTTATSIEALRSSTVTLDRSLCRLSFLASAPLRSRSVSSSSVSLPPSTTNMSFKKRPCGVSNAAQIAWPGPTLVTSLEISPCRNSTRSGPPTATTLRWGSRLNCRVLIMKMWVGRVRLARFGGRRQRLIQTAYHSPLRDSGAAILRMVGNGRGAGVNRRAALGGAIERLVAAHRHAMAVTAMREVVEHRVVLDGAVVPEGHRIG